MAHELGMEIVAEGAESESEAIELYQLGCEYAQGPVFGEPMSTLQARQLVGAAPGGRLTSGVAGFHGQHGRLDADAAQGHLVAQHRRTVLKISSASAGQLSQPLAWISISSWPAPQPA